MLIKKIQCNFIFSCIISLWAQHQLNQSPVESSILPLKKILVFSLHPTSFLFEIQYHLTHPPAKSSTLPFGKIPFQGVLSDIVFSYYPALALFCLIFTHITRQQSIRSCTIWDLFLQRKTVTIQIYIILRLVYFYCERPLLSEIYYYTRSISIAEDCRLKGAARDLDGICLID